MTTHSHEKGTGTGELAPPAYDNSAIGQRPGRITRTAPWLAGLWVGAYVPMAVLHLVRDTDPPWTHSPASALAALTSGQVSALIIALGLIAAAALAAVTASRRVGRVRMGGWLLIAVGLILTLAVADARSLSFVGYGPMLLLGLFGVGPVATGGVSAEVITGSLLSLGSTTAGIGMLVAGAHAVSDRGGRSLWGTPERTRLITRWAVGIAAVIPVMYAVTRIAWTVGVPLGVSDEFLVDLGDAKWAGFGLGAFAVVGALLTLGLVQRWGEVFWSWVPVIGGRPVPVGMAVIPALFVAAIVTSAGTGFWGSVFSGHLADLPGAQEDWAAWAPEMLWPAWGIALAVAALAYRRRRLTGTAGS
ncbi:hypothetical protein ACOCJ7_12905 [Knoellia sp. CPCC 206453]|uniref:hypothetical protein n=1 Tax=Knoellia pratensis TaxID=3404796 RepID=UPI003619054F